MDISLTRKSFWEAGSRYGLLLGLATAAVALLSQFASNLSGFTQTLAALVLWCVKFAGCIYLMLLFMKKFAAQYPQADRRDILHFGMIVALCSALVYSAFNLVYITLIDPDMLQNALQTAMQTYAGMLDSNSEAALEGIVDKMPAISFFSNLIYCTLYGTVLSAILAGRVRSNNPFNDSDADIQ